MATFRRALGAGAAGLEADARLSADGEVVLSHARSHRVGIRWLRIGATPAARLADLGIPSLRELYRELGTGFELSLDLKVRAAATSILAVAGEHRALPRLWICSDDLDVLRELRGAAPEVRLVHSTSTHGTGASLERHAADLAAAGIDAVNLHHSDWSVGLVTLFHRFEVLAFAWDVQHDRHLRAMVRIGIDGVYSDHVDRMVAAVTRSA